MAVVVVQPVILEQTLDFKQLGHDRVTCHCRRIDDSSVARTIKIAPSQQMGEPATGKAWGWYDGTRRSLVPPPCHHARKSIAG
jgi:hypothetical protein